MILCHDIISRQIYDHRMKDCLRLYYWLHSNIKKMPVGTKGCTLQLSIARQMEYNYLIEEIVDFFQDTMNDWPWEMEFWYENEIGFERIE